MRNQKASQSQGLEKIYLACARRFGFKEAELSSQLDAVMKQGDFMIANLNQYLEGRKNEASIIIFILGRLGKYLDVLWFRQYPYLVCVQR